MQKEMKDESNRNSGEQLVKVMAAVLYSVAMEVDNKVVSSLSLLISSTFMAVGITKGLFRRATDCRKTAMAHETYSTVK